MGIKPYIIGVGGWQWFRQNLLRTRVAKKIE